MANSHFFANNTSAELEKTAIERYRSLIDCIPDEVNIFREMWGTSTIVCLDFAQCCDRIEPILEQSWLLLTGLQCLGLGNAIILKNKQKIVKIINN